MSTTIMPITTSSSTSVKPARRHRIRARPFGRNRLRIENVIFRPEDAVRAGADEDIRVLPARHAGHGWVGQIRLPTFRYHRAPDHPLGEVPQHVRFLAVSAV